jgi:hypothetical protein
MRLCVVDQEENMEPVTGVFASQHDAAQAVQKLRSIGIKESRISLLTPGELKEEVGAVPVATTEQPGMGKTMGGVVGAAAGAAGGLELGAALSAFIPGVGPVIALGLMGAGLFGLAGAGIGAAIGQKAENALDDGLPEDELFVYEDALRKGKSVLMVMADDEEHARPLRDLLEQQGAESVDAAREEWWIGLRSPEQEHYTGLGRDFSQDEKFYRCGFEAALHARTRGKEYDQVLSEMQADLEELKRQHPNAEVEEPFRRGYDRGRAYYESVRTRSRASRM